MARNLLEDEWQDKKPGDWEQRSHDSHRATSLYVYVVDVIGIPYILSARRGVSAAYFSMFGSTPFPKISIIKRNVLFQ
jgi:hypothetical protein